MPQLLPVVGTMALMITFVAYQIYKIRWLRYHGRQIIVMVTSIRPICGIFLPFISAISFKSAGSLDLKSHTKLR